MSKADAYAGDLSDAIIDLVWRVLGRRDAPVAKVYMGIFKNVNALDSNLSDITDVNGNPVAGVPKSTTATFTAGDPILIITGPGVPWTIIGKVLGDITAVT